MIINGDLTFHTLGDGEVQNAIMERLAGTAGGGTLPAGTVATAGRIVYNTDDNLYYFWDGTAWNQFGGGSGSSLQLEVDNIETASGGIFDTDGTYVGAILDAADNISTSTSLANAILQLDAAIEGIDTLAELGDTTIAGLATKDVLYWSGAAWVNQQLVTTDITGVTASAAELNYTTGLTQNVETSLNNIQSYTGAADDTDTTPDYSGANVYITDGDSLTVASGKLDTALAALATTLTNTQLGDLEDVTDAVAGAIVTGDSYYLSGTGLDDYEVIAATLGSINNVAAAVDSAGTEDVLAFNGTNWTAITPATFAGDIDLGDLNNVTDSTTGANEFMYTSGAGVWVTAAAGATSGLQAHDAALDALSNVAGTGYIVQTGVDTFTTRVITVDGAGNKDGLTIFNGPGVSANTTIGLDIANTPAAGGAPIGTDTFIVYDGTNNESVSLTQINAGLKTLGIALDDLSDVDDSFTKTADAPAIFMGDGTNLDTVSIVPGTSLSGVAVTGTSYTVNVDDDFLKNDGDTLDSGSLQIASGASLAVLTGATATWPDSPTAGNHLANKAYVDSQAGGLT